MINLTVNGKPHQHEGGGSVAELLEETGARPEHTAVAINGEVVPKSQWDAVRLAEGDNVELVVFVRGG